MKIRVGEHEIGVEIVQKHACPAGTAYYKVEYLHQGVCIHAAHTGPIYGRPNPLELLDDCYNWTETHYEDIPDADPVPEGDARQGRTIKHGEYGGRPAWWEICGKTHRQAIIDAMALVVD